MSGLYWPRRLACAVLSVALFTAIAASAQPVDTWPAPASETTLLSIEPVPLDMGIVVFEAGLKPYDATNPRHVLREVESRLLAVSLRQTLERANNWGAVRVLPTPSLLTEVTVTAEIVWSDGQDLVLQVRAADATERVWFDRQFRASAPPSMSGQDSGSDSFDSSVLVGLQSDPYAPAFVAIANALSEVAREFTPREVDQLLTTASMRYAASLAPSAYGNYLRSTDVGIELLRLPARDDPMLARIDRIRNQEALFVDSADEQYVDLEQALLPTYRLWQQSSREQRLYLNEYTQRAQQRETSGSRGSFAVLQQQYATYRSLRIQEQDVYDLATGFDNETEATVMRFGDRVVTLSGSLDQQYGQWKRLLAEIFRLEQGLTP